MVWSLPSNCSHLTALSNYLLIQVPPWQRSNWPVISLPGRFWWRKCSSKFPSSLKFVMQISRFSVNFQMIWTNSADDAIKMLLTSEENRSVEFNWISWKRADNWISFLKISSQLLLQKWAVFGWILESRTYLSSRKSQAQTLKYLQNKIYICIRLPIYILGPNWNF